MNLNKTQLIGTLVADPAARKLPSGRPVAQFRLVTKTITKNERSDMVFNHPEYHHVVAYGRLAEVVGKYLKKGDRVYLDGSLATRRWKDDSGVDRNRTEILMQNLIMLGGAKKSNSEPTNDDIVQEEVKVEGEG